MDRVAADSDFRSELPSPFVPLLLIQEALQLMADQAAALVLDRLGERHEYMGTEEAAEYLGWQKKRIDNLCCQQAIPFKKVGGRRLFRRDELDAWYEAQHGVSVASALTATS